ncbi:MAG: hypothetical protein EZS28_004168 [Streblomastix strix]|uniref:Uncharacterized protein n=1 Tax=Streblomastix strix TaxID=222440 RepID=A0A5J4X1F3_9EUKA|nr:MAG: hypothetical protein EZS28_004168 [Streblomastix strix]
MLKNNSESAGSIEAVAITHKVILIDPDSQMPVLSVVLGQLSKASLSTLSRYGQRSFGVSIVFQLQSTCRQIEPFFGQLANKVKSVGYGQIVSGVETYGLLQSTEKITYPELIYVQVAPLNVNGALSSKQYVALYGLSYPTNGCKQIQTQHVGLAQTIYYIILNTFYWIQVKCMGQIPSKSGEGWPQPGLKVLKIYRQTS